MQDRSRDLLYFITSSYPLRGFFTQGLYSRLSQCCGPKSFSVPNTWYPESTWIMYTGIYTLECCLCSGVSNSPSRALVPPATSAKGMCLGLKQIPWGEWISGLLRFVHPFSSQFPYLSHLSFCWLFHFLITLFLEKSGRERKYSIKPVSTDFHFHSAYYNRQARLLLGVSTTDKIFALFVQLEQI